jgi:sarcosine oxidase subunit gamma
MSAIVARRDLGRVPAFDVLADIASAEYLFGCLEDAMAEFGGRLVGLAALRELGGAQ